MPSHTQSLSPVRIFVLWHPGLDNPEDLRGCDPKSLADAEKERVDRGLKLARRIYYWFRMENMEGIPVYFRSAPAPGQLEEPRPIETCPGVRNYIIPLVDANMVSSPDWRAYVAKYADQESNAKAVSRRGKQAAAPQFRLLPVAMESVAYNMPECMRKLNFIRHIPTDDKIPDGAALIARLTEVICRDLRAWLRQATEAPAKKAARSAKAAPPDKIRIFLSHAKADDTDEALALKEYIQRETQCEAFFDETDIASAYDYTRVLESAITLESAGLIVIQGDNYADRPWCRKEIRDFLKPIPDPVAADSRCLQYFVPPAVVVQTMKGRQIARTIPELGYSPCVRWQAEAARFVVTTLLREILFGLFYRTLANRIAQRSDDEADVFINRSPDPVMINRILADKTLKKRLGSGKPCSFVHPGYGLSSMEKDGLNASFPDVTFTSFLGRSSGSDPDDLELSGRIIAVSVGGSRDILAHGLSDEHIQELLIRLMRPLLRSQASLLYGGRMPDTLRPAEPWKARLNFTAALLQLLLSERQTNPEGAQSNARKAVTSPRLYIPVPCHELRDLTAQKVAQWTDVCTFVRVPTADSGVAPEELAAARPLPPTEAELEYLSDAEKRALKDQRKAAIQAFDAAQLALKARGYSALRQKICARGKDALVGELPDTPKDTGRRSVKIETFAHLLVGGKTEGFTGIMPGIFEEVLHALNAHKPVFLIAGYGGAAALLASWLIGPCSRPVELTVEHYERSNPKFRVIRQELDKLTTEEFPQLAYATPQSALDALWALLEAAQRANDLSTLFHNGLNHEENLTLLKSVSSFEICQLVWTGISRISPPERKAPCK